MIKLLSLLMILFCQFSIAASPSKVTLGFVPGENPEKLKKNGKELSQFLEKKLGVPIEVFIPQNYEGLVQAMADKAVDFGFFTALTYIEAEKKSAAKVLLKKVWDAPYYFSALVTLKESGIENIKKLKNKKIGFIDEKSASGFLYPSVMFKKQGIEPKKYFSKVVFYGNHEAAVEALYKKEVDVVTVFADDEFGKTGAWNKSRNFKNNTKVLWVSEPIPNDPFCVRKDFYEKYPRYTHDLMFTLIDMQDDPAEKALLKELIGVESLALATSRQYEPVRELVKILK